MAFPVLSYHYLADTCDVVGTFYDTHLSQYSAPSAISLFAESLLFLYALKQYIYLRQGYHACLVVIIFANTIAHGLQFLSDHSLRTEQWESRLLFLVTGLLLINFNALYIVMVIGRMRLTHSHYHFPHWFSPMLYTAVFFMNVLLCGICVLQVAHYELGIQLATVSAFGIMMFGVIAVVANNLVLEAAVSTAFHLQEKPRSIIEYQRRKMGMCISLSMGWFVILVIFLIVKELQVGDLPLESVAYHYLAFPVLAVHYFCELKFLKHMNQLVYHFPLEKPIKELV